MDAKLTLKLDKSVIDRAKQYAALHNKSLSRMFETYLKTLLDKKNPQSDNEIEISPFVRSLRSGVSIPADLNSKEEYGDYLENKYK